MTASAERGVEWRLAREVMLLLFSSTTNAAGRSGDTTDVTNHRCALAYVHLSCEWQRKIFPCSEGLRATEHQKQNVAWAGCVGEALTGAPQPIDAFMVLAVSALVLVG
jgi:hypothetical protein